MKYYGLVDKINDSHVSGVYARRPLSEEEIKRISQSTNTNEYEPYIKFIPFVYPTYVLWKLINKVFPPTYTTEITIQQPIDSENKTLIIPNEGLNNNYSLSKNKDLLYGLLDGFNNSEKAFETILNSKGGSELVIYEKSSISSERHYGGKYGKFNSGLYCEHPKDSKRLIPLENSNELIKTFILEEIIQCFEALGAKRIIIEDKTDIEVGLGVKSPINGDHFESKMESNYNNRILRNKEFGKGTFDTERCFSNLLFIPDFPNIMTVINSRVYGNQTVEEFTESINLGANLDVNVLSLYKSQIGFKYNRTWYFRVDFYDKNEIK